MQSTAAIDEHAHWNEALAAIGLDEDSSAPAPDLSLFFASPAYEGTEELVLGCLLYPDRRTFSKHLEAQSGVLAKVANACVELAGFKVEVVGAPIDVL